MNRKLIAIALATLMLVASSPAQLPNYTGAVTWQGNSTYTIGAYVLYQGVLYQALQQNTNISPTAGAPNWAQILGYNALDIQGVPVSSTAPTNGQTLVYNSTIGQWAPGTGGGGSGGMTLISKQTVSAATASVTFSAIPQTFNNLRLVCNFTITSGSNIAIAFNGSAGAGNYEYALIFSDYPSTTAVTQFAYGLNSAIFGSSLGTAIMEIPNYTAPSPLDGIGSFSSSAPSSIVAGTSMVTTTGVSSVSSITLADSGGTALFAVGSTFTLYGY